MVIVSSNIEGDHGLPLDCRVVAEQLQNFFKAVKYQCGDNDTLEKSSLGYFLEVIKQVNKKEYEHEDQKRSLVQG